METGMFLCFSVENLHENVFFHWLKNMFKICMKAQSMQYFLHLEPPFPKLHHNGKGSIAWGCRFQLL